MNVHKKSLRVKFFRSFLWANIHITFFSARNNKFKIYELLSRIAAVVLCIEKVDILSIKSLADTKIINS